MYSQTCIQFSFIGYRKKKNKKKKKKKIKMFDVHDWYEWIRYKTEFTSNIFNTFILL